LASRNPQRTERASQGHRLTRRRLSTHAYTLAIVGVLLALLALAPSIRAQSGRNKQPTAKTSTPSTGTTRPKRVGTNSDSQNQKPAQSQTPAVKLPSGTVVMDEAPPPAPTPKPTPVTDTSAGEEIGAEDVVKITSNLVTVPASVVDAQGRAVIDLKLEDFELRVDGQPRPISDLSRSEVPVTLALLFDNSESLSAARELEKQAAIKFFRTVIRPIDRAAVYSVATDVDLVQPLTNNVPALVHTIERFGKPEGATKLLDAIVEAATYLRPYPGRKVIVIVSDGEDTLSDNTDFDAVLRRVLTADCQVYAVQTKQIEYAMLTGETGNANIRALAAERRLQDLTSHTGGAVYTPMVTNDLEAAFAQISADLSHQYILSYYPADDRGDGRFRTISVRIATRANMRVRARRGYYPRRPNDRFSNNTQPAGLSEPVINQNNAAMQTRAVQRAPAPTDNLPALSSSNISTPEKSGDSAPLRSRRKGPTDSGDDATETGSNVKAVSTVESEPVIKGGAVTTRASEPTAPPPKPVASPTPTPSPSAPPSSAASPAASKSTPPASDTAKTSQSQTAKPIRDVPFNAGVINGKAISLPKPQYPPNARTMRAEGLVTVEVLLDEEGKVLSAKAVDGNAVLRQAAINAARLARFSPTLLAGQPVKVTGVITYKFTLAQ
jgi:Ca-activated chloride channel family protein